MQSIRTINKSYPQQITSSSSQAHFDNTIASRSPYYESFSSSPRSYTSQRTLDWVSTHSSTSWAPSENTFLSLDAAVAHPQILNPKEVLPTPVSTSRTSAAPTYLDPLKQNFKITEEFMEYYLDSVKTAPQSSKMSIIEYLTGLVLRGTTSKDQVFAIRNAFSSTAASDFITIRASRHDGSMELNTLRQGFNDLMVSLNTAISHRLNSNY